MTGCSEVVESWPSTLCYKAVIVSRWPVLIGEDFDPRVGPGFDGSARRPVDAVRAGLDGISNVGTGIEFESKVCAVMPDRRESKEAAGIGGIGVALVFVEV